MKKLLSSLLLLIVFHITINAQKQNKTTTPVLSETSPIMPSIHQVLINDSNQDLNVFSYLVGSEKLVGYDVKIYSYATTDPKIIKTFNNGKTAPVLQLYVIDKAKYIGGILEDQNGKTTIIKNITLEEKDSTLLFKVTGEAFSMSFTLSNGSILKEEEDLTIFFTDKVGTWKINKKK